VSYFVRAWGIFRALRLVGEAAPNPAAEDSNVQSNGIFFAHTWDGAPAIVRRLGDQYRNAHYDREQAGVNDHLDRDGAVSGLVPEVAIIMGDVLLRNIRSGSVANSSHRVCD